MVRRGSFADALPHPCREMHDGSAGTPGSAGVNAGMRLPFCVPRVLPLFDLPVQADENAPAPCPH